MKRIIDDITDFIFVSDEPGEADIIFIPGGSWPQPAIRAAELYGAGLATLVMPSGKYGKELGRFAGVKDVNGLYPGPYATECEFYADILIKNGVPKEAILAEDQSTYTQENAVFSRSLCEKNGVAVRRALLCCKAFHARRSLMYYQMAFPDAAFMVIPVDAGGVRSDNWYQSPSCFDRVMSELAKCGSQVAENLGTALKL